MSLLDDPLTKHLWQQVQNMASYENAAQSFWHHIYTKDVFANRVYAVDYEDPPIPEEQGLRKVDQVVKMLEPNWGTLFVLLFHEIKRNECSSAELEYLETQAFTACESYCKKHGISQVYAQTSVGSRARFFLYKPGSWTPVDNLRLGDFTAYQEFGNASGEAYILGWLQNIKTGGLSLPKVTWMWDAARQQHYYLTPLYFIFADGTKVQR
ncbi:hypothetical protein PtrCC142_010767 [Pyrenophora tritici-repentis]|nr:hypothetical protein PtrSN001C_010738 [Pyrenophora tritici-repentis]KAI1562690.1 hypothetical protein PtrEW4_009833 [Pyrenophora tritici-repentis]KAI1576353.1 hypothetical protein PtrEW13061_010683 [Pyrenophora tritici-repentis]KAI1594708.1 hypothetical protein PtrCC142_010767 [Pyrenophora tritici-repentis]